MKILFPTLMFILGMSLFANTGLAQWDKNSGESKTPDEQRMIAEQQQRNAKTKQDKMFDQVNQVKKETGSGAWKNPVSSTREKKTIRKDERKYAELLDKMLAAPAEYQAKFADLLKNKKMNLVRIYPDKNCDFLKEKTISLQEAERCEGVVPLAGGGSQYSFKEKTNVYFGWYGVDIHFIAGEFITGNETAKGIITEVGDVALENINAGSAAVKFLIESKPKKTLTELKEQNKLFEKGINSNGFTYSGTAPYKLNSTYFLRSIAYKTKWKPVSENRGKQRFEITDITGTFKDILVAFKIVGREQDGSLIILWKELKIELPRRELE